MLNIWKIVKISISDLNFYFKTLAKEEQSKSKLSRKKEIIKIKAEVDKPEKQSREKSMKPKAGCF